MFPQSKHLFAKIPTSSTPKARLRRSRGRWLMRLEESSSFRRAHANASSKSWWLTQKWMRPTRTHPYIRCTCSHIDAVILTIGTASSATAHMICCFIPRGYHECTTPPITQCNTHWWIKFDTHQYKTPVTGQLVARDFRPSGEKSVFEKMAIKIVVKKSAKKNFAAWTTLYCFLKWVVFFCCCFLLCSLATCPYLFRELFQLNYGQ